MQRRFDKLLIANRGEIACRIVRTAKRMQLRTVAVFSDADRDAMHVGLADESVRIGPAPARESYLRSDALIEAARRSGAEAVHPGYGFLAENADFAQACVDAGLVFVGPSAQTIRRMGSKSQAKQLMEAAGVPVVPGYHGEDQDDVTLTREAARIGYPVLIKASAGGGGRGMRTVAQAAAFAEALAGARREAAAAFGDDRMLIEKCIERPRHVEIQVFGDAQGNVVSLFERDCTLQRRHQKVVEEAPASAIASQRRQEMAAAARVAAKAAGYIGAGTVEFITDLEAFYFIEMNTRLQVEHPVTEMVTGLDLVEWQLRIAMGEALPELSRHARLYPGHPRLPGHEDADGRDNPSHDAREDDAITTYGHAIETRIYAEDADKGFLPAAGIISRWRQPDGEGIRIDTGFRAGDAVTPYYDALLAKLIAWGEDRAQALSRLVDALGSFEIAGVTTNLAFLELLVSHPQVARGDIDTGFIEREIAALTLAGPTATPLDIAAASAAVLAQRELSEPLLSRASSPSSPWDRSDGWSSTGRRNQRLSFRYGTQRYDALICYERDGLSLEFGGRRDRLQFVARDGHLLDLCLGDAPERVSVAWSGRQVALTTPRGHIELHWIDPFAGEAAEVAEASRIVAPMPGTITRILAQVGVEVPRGTPLIVLEAMKMEHTLRAPFAGRLKALRCATGEFVQEGTELADFEPAGDSE